MSKLLVSIVTYNSERYIARALDALAAQVNKNFDILVVDNASADGTATLAKDFQGKVNGQLSVVIQEIPVNLGFSGGHNKSVKTFLNDSRYEWILFLNPDVSLAPDAIHNFFRATSADASLGMISPKLYRANEDLKPVEPLLLDAAGMTLTTELRHFDRGSNQKDTFDQQEIVFGGTGACLFIHRRAVNELLLQGKVHDSDSYRVFPALSYEPHNRAPLFDEGFFAYREDADLCWRANLLGIRIHFLPEIIGFHRRLVLSTNREQVSSRLNGLSVANRFLLQINNYFFVNSFQSLVIGILFRNLLVIGTVLVYETTSLPYLRNVFLLLSRARERRRILRSRIKHFTKIV